MYKLRPNPSLESTLSTVAAVKTKWGGGVA